ncbi:MAG: HAD-IIIA family hydrolase [Acidobacteriaceae bacterium]|nr:HAD-IIIA family hydrolase [Acidobacteriaceae bacterium]MBV9302596.1 HAD-IIIA family hydrolase [Acidobacteriaceae bacterium]
MSRARAVFLDRDGVINESIIREGKPFPPTGIENVVIAPDAKSSLNRLKEVGFLLFVVTNQPDVSRGTTSKEKIDEIHQLLSGRLPLDEFFVCYHDDRDACECRKPLPGLLFQAVAKHDIDLRNSYLIGDRWRDIEAGTAAGCRTILIDHHYQERRASGEDATVISLTEAVDWILNEEARAT